MPQLLDVMSLDRIIDRYGNISIGLKTLGGKKYTSDPNQISDSGMVFLISEPDEVIKRSLIHEARDFNNGFRTFSVEVPFDYTPKVPKCPSCSHELTMNGNEPRCRNIRCRGVLGSRLAHMVSPEGLAIQSLTPGKCREFVDNSPWFKSLDQIFDKVFPSQVDNTLTAHDLAYLTKVRSWYFNTVANKADIGVYREALKNLLWSLSVPGITHVESNRFVDRCLDTDVDVLPAFCDIIIDPDRASALGITQNSAKFLAYNAVAYINEISHISALMESMW